MRHKNTMTALILILFILTTGLRGQDSEIDRLIEGEFKMTFPSIYFKHNSTDYSTMPYSVDSCFKYIATNIKYLNSYPIWRDSSEAEQLTNKRIKKLKDDLNKYTPSRKINIKSVGNKQKISQRTINKGIGNEQIQYLLSLNSVLDVSGVIHPKKKWTRRTHYEGRYLCFGCWRRGAFTKEYQRLHGRKKKK
jgi:hypothetical protein